MLCEMKPPRTFLEHKDILRTSLGHLRFILFGTNHKLFEFAEAQYTHQRLAKFGLFAMYLLSIIIKQSTQKLPMQFSQAYIRPVSTINLILVPVDNMAIRQDIIKYRSKFSVGYETGQNFQALISIQIQHQATDNDNRSRNRIVD